MQNSSMYIGVTVTSKGEDGSDRLSYHGHGPDYHGLEYADVVAMEAVLASFSEQYDALAREVEAALLVAGFEKAGISQPDKPNKPVR